MLYNTGGEGHYAARLSCARVQLLRSRAGAHVHQRVSASGRLGLRNNIPPRDLGMQRVSFKRAPQEDSRDLGTQRVRLKGRRERTCFGQTTKKASHCRHSAGYVFRLCWS